MSETITENKYELKNFDMLKILGKKEKDINVIKARYKIDNKIYCLRKIKKGNYFDDDIKKLKEFLININHPHIIKYYDIFEEKEYLYFLMEYIETDIKDYIESNKIMNRKIPEENIYFLLLQCLSVLSYIHSKIIKDNKKGSRIRLSNILMPTERGIKISLIKNELTSEWKEKDDILLLYKYFEFMLFERFKFDYDKELRAIIYYIDTDFNKIEKNYIDKFSNGNKNTSIKSIFNCLSNCENLKNYITKQKNEKNDYLFNIFKAIFKKEDDKYFKSIEKLKRLLALEYSTLDETKEINPIFVINLFLNCNKNISDFFSVKKKIIRTCKNCKNEIHSNENENSITFDMIKIDKEIFNLSLDGFGKFNKNKNKEIDLYCNKCYSKQKFDESYDYNGFSDYLIIYFDRGHSLTDKTKIAFASTFEIKFNYNIKAKFDFIGCIIKKDNYIFESLKDFKAISTNEQDKIMILIYQKV